MTDNIDWWVALPIGGAATIIYLIQTRHERRARRAARRTTPKSGGTKGL